MEEDKGQFLQDVKFEGVQDQSLEALKNLNRAIFPINYQDKVYQDILACGDISQLAFYQGRLIGAITCRLENTAQGVQMYIITLGVLAPHRGMGVGSLLVKKSLQVVHTCLPEVQAAYLHVQADNDEAITFYSRLGFQVVETIEKYYRRTSCLDAVLLRLDLHPSNKSWCLQ